MAKFKVGARVSIIGRTAIRHNFNIGDVVTVMGIDKDGDYICRKGRLTQIVHRKDIEMVNTWDTLKAGQTIVDPSGYEHTVMAVVGDCVFYSDLAEGSQGGWFRSKQNLIDNGWKIKGSEEVKLTIDGKEVSLSAESVEAIRNVVRK